MIMSSGRGSCAAIVMPRPIAAIAQLVYDCARLPFYAPTVPDRSGNDRLLQSDIERLALYAAFGARTARAALSARDIAVLEATPCLLRFDAEFDPVIDHLLFGHREKRDE